TAFESRFGAKAVHTSAVPAWVLVRRASVHERTPPETVAVWVGDELRSLTNATSKSLGDVVSNVGVATAPTPSTKNDWSNTNEPCDCSGLTGVTVSPLI